MSPRPDELRIGDAERERAQATLSDHYAAGRLDHDEYSERLDRIWAARTQGDLDPLFTDLPGEAPRRTAYATPQQRMAADRPRRRGPRLPVPLLALLAVLAGVAVLSHLPVILIALAVWFVFLRGGCRPRPHQWSHRRF